jgi:hypothetical protein
VAASYPASVKSFTTKVDFTDIVLAEHVNSLQDEVNALESKLGTYVNVGSGWVGTFDKTTTNWNTLKDRLANIEYGLNNVWTAVPTGGTTGQVLVKTSSSDYATAWSTFDGLPSQSGNSGKYLTTNGSTASWVTIAADIEGVTAGTGLTGGGTSGTVTLNLDTTSVYVVPSQSGNSGKYLTTNGSTASWGTVSQGGDALSAFLLAGC